MDVRYRPVLAMRDCMTGPVRVYKGSIVIKPGFILVEMDYHYRVSEWHSRMILPPSSRTAMIKYS